MATLRQAIEPHRDRGTLPRAKVGTVGDLIRQFGPGLSGSMASHPVRMSQAISELPKSGHRSISSRWLTRQNPRHRKGSTCRKPPSLAAPGGRQFMTGTVGSQRPQRGWLS